MRLILSLIIFFIGCAPITFSEIQNAKLVNKGEYELTPSMSIAHNTKNFGIQGAYGLSKNTNIRMRIERIIIKTDFEEGRLLSYFNIKESLTHFSTGVKYNLIKNRLALYIPVSFTLMDNTPGSQLFLIEPTLLSTFFGRSIFEINPSIKIITNPKHITEPIWVANLGIGISPDLRQWALRLEAGCLGLPRCMPQVSLGLSIYH